MFSIAVVTPPAEEPLTLQEVKANLRFPFDSEDARISSLIVAARRYCERATGRAFITQTLRLTLDRFPTAREGFAIRLPRPPVQSVTSVVHLAAADGVSTTVATDDYLTDLASEPARIVPSYATAAWPDARDQMGAVSVTYVAGYGDAADVPETIKQAMHLLIAHWFKNREAAGDNRVESRTAIAVKELLGCEWTGQYAGDFG